MKRLLRVGAVVLVAAIGLAGCGGDDDDEAGGTTTTAAVAEPTKLTINAGEPAEGKFAFGGVPATVTGGLVEITFNNTGAQDHEIQLVRFDDPHTADEVLANFANEEDGAPIPDWIHGAGGAATIKGGATTTASVVLPNGNYAVMCLIDDENAEEDAADAGHYQRGMFTSFKVTGSTAAELPETMATVVATETSAEAYTFSVTGLKAGRNSVTFQNNGSQIHHAIMLPIAEGKTFEDLVAAFAGPPTGPPPIDEAAATGLPAIDGGNSMVGDVELRAGDYAFACFIQDRSGGDPHAFSKGMISKVTVA